MRSRKILLALGLIGALGVGLALSGCSSDDRPTPPVKIIDDQYTNVQSEIDDVVEEMIVLMAATMEMYESNSQVTDTAVIADLRESSFDPDTVLNSDNWYILISDQISAAFGLREIDSIMFTNDGATVEFAGEGNGIMLRHIYEYANVDTDVTYTDYNTKGDLTFSGLNTDEATISGSWSAFTIDQVVDGQAEIRTFTIVAEVSNLVVAKGESGWASGCPLSGSIDFTVDLSYIDGDNPVAVSAWDFMVTFADGEGSVSVSDGTVTADYANAYCIP